MTPEPSPLRFAVIGINHGHIYSQVNALLRAGAELCAFYAPEENLAPAFQQAYPQVQRAFSQEQILVDETIQLVVSASIPAERAPLGMQVMQHGKDFMSDKPGFTTLQQLSETRKVQAETGQIYSIMFSERLENPAAVKASELVQAGAIGQVIQTVGLGPHRANLPSRPEWFFRKERYGGILVDIASHQVDQFLFFTGSTSAEILASQVGNFKNPQHPELEDFGEMLLRGDQGSGYIRVDWYTPDGLPTFGDGRLTILGSEGFIELRKYCDLAGRPGGDHLFLVDRQGVNYIDCAKLDLPYGRQFIADIRNRTETAMPQAHVFLASEIALKAEERATRLGFLTG
jgi:predicted dehydrogenase